jgi:hypothetical protein
VATFRTLVNPKRDSKDADASTQAMATATSKPAVYTTQKWLTNAEDAVHTRDNLNETEGQRAESQDKATVQVSTPTARLRPRWLRVSWPHTEYSMR